MQLIARWKYRFLTWFFDQPDALNRRVEVEIALLKHVKDATSAGPKECAKLAMKLGVPSKFWNKQE